MRRVVLIRHTDVAAHWQGRCYGRSDVGLSSAGRIAAHAIAHDLDVSMAAVVITSPLRRARVLATLIARKIPAKFSVEPRLAECNFGTWEGRAWGDIYAETGTAMMGLIEAPGHFRPGGGETTFELRDRAMAWLQDLPQCGDTIVAVTHGGPIAVISGTIAGAPVKDWPSFVPAYGARVEIDV